MIRVLIVDDDKLVRKGLISVLPWKEFGMEVVGEANHGASALEFMETQQVDLLITDLSMPVMSGIELMREVRKRYSYVQIVVLSLHQDFDYVQEALRLGAIDYIAKIELEREQLEEVLGRVSALMERKLRSMNDSFYEMEPIPSLAESSVSLQPNPDNNRDLERMKESWLSSDWIYNQNMFEAKIMELKALRLPPARLARIFFSLCDEWNRLYQQLLASPIVVDDHFVSWKHLEVWLRTTRETIHQAVDRPQYSQEIKNSIVRAMQLAQQRISDQISAAEMAQMVNMSSSYFSQCFKQIAGQTYSDYMRDIRMERAKDYLVKTSRTIQWIAEQVGYHDDKYFSRLFREQVGMLPSEFRQKTAQT